MGINTDGPSINAYNNSMINVDADNQLAAQLNQQQLTLEQQAGIDTSDDDDSSDDTSVTTNSDLSVATNSANNSALDSLYDTGDPSSDLSSSTALGPMALFTQQQTNL